MTASPSSRRAWIEIKALDAGVYRTQVALLAEGVDRNWQEKKEEEYHEVALLAEGVDRNGISSQICSARSMVALLAEGVDRNMKRLRKAVSGPRRPPRGGRG